MQRVFVCFDKNKKPLMPCRPQRANRLLKTGRACVFKQAPFTIIIKDRVGGDIQPLECKIDPGFSYNRNSPCIAWQKQNWKHMGCSPAP